MDRFKFITDKNFKELPKATGVYFFYSKSNTQNPTPVYVGKAINIQNRVKNHFQQPSYRDDLFIDKIHKIGYIKTNSEIEALVLEAKLIKKYQPRFNVVWRDDKNYFYVAINRENIPYIFITHQKNHQKTEYIGPFVEGTALKKTLKFLRRVFPFYTQARHPKTKCTYCHLELCPGPLPDLIAYKKNINKLVLILEGKRNKVLYSLKKEMKQLSEVNRFEEAGKIRDKIYNLQQVMSHKGVIRDEQEVSENFTDAKNNAFALLGKITNLEKISKIECYDVSNIQGKFATGSMVVFVNGVPDKSQYKKFKIRMKNEPNDIAMLREVLTRRFSHPEWKCPEIILIDGGKAQLNTAINLKIAKVKVMSIAKGKQELFIEGRADAIPLKNLPQEVYNLILQLDAQAHRFAINYHKKLRRKALLV